MPADADLSKFVALQSQGAHGLYIEPGNQPGKPDVFREGWTSYALRVATDKMVDFDNLEHLQNYFPNPEQTTALLWPAEPEPHLPTYCTRAYLHRYAGVPEFRNAMTFPRLLHSMIRNMAAHHPWAAVMDPLWLAFLNSINTPGGDQGTHNLLKGLGIGWLYGNTPSEDWGDWAGEHLLAEPINPHDLTETQRLLHAITQHVGVMPLMAARVLDMNIDPFYATIQGQLSALAEPSADRPN
jgi:hypothetical protein